ncbi:MAG TPA: glycosyltransferase [Rhodopila sp.]|nr:glycosyltransferase [Rhodopila sp.]
MTYPAAMRFLFLNQATARQHIPVQAEDSAIPRIIHQTHSSQDALPPAICESIAALRARNPDWDYRFYDDAAVTHFIREAYGATVLAYFNRIDPRYGAARADLFRYLLMYRVGGVYLDIKSTARLPLDDIVGSGNRLILTQWPRNDRFEGAGRHDWEFAGKIKGGEFQQWHVICPPGHPYLYAVIQAVMRNIDCYIPRMHGSGRNAVLRLTGPIAYTLAILPLLAFNQHVLVTDHEALGLDYSVYPGNADHKRLFRTHYTELTAPIVRPSPFRFCLSALYGVFDRLRGRRDADDVGTPIA